MDSIKKVAVPTTATKFLSKISFLVLIICLFFRTISFSAEIKNKGITIAITKIQNISEGAELDSLEETLTRFIMTDLMKIDGIKVVERGRLEEIEKEYELSGAGITDSLLQPYQALHADYILTGNFKENPNQRGNIIVQLNIIDVNSGKKVSLGLLQIAPQSLINPSCNKLAEPVLKLLNIDTPIYHPSFGITKLKEALIIGDFEPSGLVPSKYLSLGKFFVDSLIADLSQIDSIKLVEREKLHDILYEQKISFLSVLNPQEAVKVSKLLGAKYILLNYFTMADDEMRLDSYLVDSQTTVILSSYSSSGNLSNFYKIEKDLVYKLVENSKSNREYGQIIGAVPTRSLEAAIYAGRAISYYDDCQFHDAIDEYKKAVFLDSAYNKCVFDIARIYREKLFDYNNAAVYYRRFLKGPISQDISISKIFGELVWGIYRNIPGRYPEVRDILKDVIARYPNTLIAFEAQKMIAHTYYSDGVNSRLPELLEIARQEYYRALKLLDEVNRIQGFGNIWRYRLPVYDSIGFSYYASRSYNKMYQVYDEIMEEVLLNWKSINEINLSDFFCHLITAYMIEGGREKEVDDIMTRLRVKGISTQIITSLESTISDFKKHKENLTWRYEICEEIRKILTTYQPSNSQLDQLYSLFIILARIYYEGEAVENPKMCLELSERFIEQYSKDEELAAELENKLRATEPWSSIFKNDANPALCTAKIVKDIAEINFITKAKYIVNSYLNMGNVEEALKVCDKVLTISTSSESAQGEQKLVLLPMGEIYEYYYKDYEKAIDCYNKLVNENTAHLHWSSEALNRMIRIYRYRLKDYDKALQICQRLYELNQDGGWYQMAISTPTQALLEMARIYLYDTREYGKAKNTLEKFFLHIHDLLSATGEHDKYNFWYKRIMDDKRHIRALLIKKCEGLYELAVCYEKLNKPEDAIATYQAYLNESNNGFWQKYNVNYRVGNIRTINERIEGLRNKQKV